MKNILTLLVSSVFFLFSCGKEKGNMVISGQIKGLKKGTLYLQKKVNSKIVTVDSVKLFGNDIFELSDNVKSPEMYSITFDSNNQQKKLLFFGEAGKITINDNIEQFGWKPQVKGSKNHELYEKFKQIDDVYKNKRLNFIKKDIEARAKKDSNEVKNLEKQYKKMMNKRFASTIQFALFHKNHEVAPYLAITELFDANFIFIDSINNSLSKKIKESTYGKQLNKYVQEIKKSK